VVVPCYFDDAFLFEYLDVAVYLVVGAVDDADEICYMSAFNF
jgi:hypothetical protein